MSPFFFDRNFDVWEMGVEERKGGGHEMRGAAAHEAPTVGACPTCLTQVFFCYAEQCDCEYKSSAGMTYSFEDVQTLVRRFEKCAERVVVNRNAPVKFNAAQRDLLAAAEKIRDVCIEALRGDRDLLQEVFGGSCELIGRLLVVFDEMQAQNLEFKDQRWGWL